MGEEGVGGDGGVQNNSTNITKYPAAPTSVFTPAPPTRQRPRNFTRHQGKKDLDHPATKKSLSIKDSPPLYSGLPPLYCVVFS